MNVAKLELCKRLYELSGWGYTHQSYNDTGTEQHPHYELHDKVLDEEEPMFAYPAYSAGYLLRKLPPSLDVRQGNWFELYNDSGDHWDAGYEYATSEPETSGYYQHADTPEDALALLCIRLIEEGILKHD